MCRNLYFFINFIYFLIYKRKISNKMENRILKVIEFFSGIGSQTRALKNIGIKHDVVNTCEWSINSIISYAQIHTDNKDYGKSNEEMINHLSKYTFSMDTKVPYDIKKLKSDKLRLLYNSHLNSKNLASIVNVNGENLNADLLTYSFPCQDLSNQGKGMGLYDGKSSSLLWEVGRILDEMKEKPEVLLMENVSSILSNKHKTGFEKWKKFLEEMGYKNIVLKLKSSYFGIPQNRERCYMISTKNKNFEFNIQGKLTEKKISDYLEKNVSDFYYKDNLLKHLPKKLNTSTTKNGIISFDLIDYTNFNSENKVYMINSISPTITATGANSRVKIYDGGRIRILTPLECLRLMGFLETDYEKLKEIHTHSEIIKQAGNSIVVNVLEEIFKKIYL